MKYTFLLILLAIISPLALADTHEAVAITTESQAQYCDFLSEDIGMEQEDEVPGFIPYKNERVALFDLEENPQGHVVTEDGIVTSVGCESIEESTYNVYIASQESIEAVFMSESPLGELDEQKAQGNIVVKGQSFSKQVKNGFASAGIKVLSWFGL